MPQHRAALGYPLVPQRMALAPIPLHAGAQRLCAELGYSGESTQAAKMET